MIVVLFPLLGVAVAVLAVWIICRGVDRIPDEDLW